MSEKENEKNYVVTTCRVPKDLHTAVSRKLAGKLDTFQSIMIQALEEYVRPKRLRIVAPEPPTSEHARLGAQLLAALERYKASDSPAAAYIAGHLELSIEIQHIFRQNCFGHLSPLPRGTGAAWERRARKVCR